jgi:glucose/arabinose dehydrogenase
MKGLRNMRCVWVLVLVSLVGSSAAWGLSDASIQAQGRRYAVQLPPGYVLELLTDGLKGPRLITFAPGGELLVGSRTGRVYRIPPPYTRPQVLVRFGGYPHSVALRAHDGAAELFVAETRGLYKASYQPGSGLKKKDFSRLAALPGGGSHTSRSVGVGPDGRVYVSLGISGNCVDEYLGAGYPLARRRGGVYVLDETGANPVLKAYASGLRNPVGFAWQPGSGALYATNNGPDHLGYEEPREYLSRLAEGSFHGMPWFQLIEGRIQRDRCIAGEPPRGLDEVVMPAATFDARNAPMGIAFVPEGAMDEGLVGDAVVALHGSWATRPRGGSGGDPATRRAPKLVVVDFEQRHAQGVRDLVTGFQLPNGTRWARPVGVAIGPDGALYFTSDSGVEGLFRLRRVR